MLILFFESKGVIHHEYLPEGQTVNATFYVQILDNLCKCFASMRPEMWRDWRSFFSMIMQVRILQRSSSSFWPKKEWQSTVTLQKFARCKPHDYFTFPKLKLELKDDHNASIEDNQKSVTAKLKAFLISDFARAMKWPEDRIECQETILNKYYIFEFLEFFHHFRSIFAKLTGHTMYYKMLSLIKDL